MNIFGKQWKIIFGLLFIFWAVFALDIYGQGVDKPKPIVSPAAQPASTANQNVDATLPKPFWEKAKSDPLALFTCLFTGVLAIVSIFQGYMLYRTAKIAEVSAKAAFDGAKAAENASTSAIESNRISRAAMIADQRPWISLDVEVAGALAYTADGWSAGFRWHIPLQYVLNNLGKTPATNVSVYGTILPSTVSHFTEFKEGIPFGLPTDGTDIIKEMEDCCAFLESTKFDTRGHGMVLFPNEHTSGIFGLNGNPNKFQAAKGGHAGYTGQFIVVMCVTYTSTLDDSRHRTAKAFHLFKRTGTRRINLGGEVIPSNDLAFVFSEVSGSYTR